MINSTSILTTNFKKLEINQFINSHSSGMHKLYGFLSYTPNIENIVLKGQVAETKFRIKKCSLRINTNFISINNTKYTSFDFFEGQLVISESDIFNGSNKKQTTITSITIENGKIKVFLQDTIIKDQVIDLSFSGFNLSQKSKLLTLHNGVKDNGKILDSANTELSINEDYYNKYLLKVIASIDTIIIHNCTIVNDSVTKISFTGTYPALASFLRLDLTITIGDDEFKNVSITNKDGNTLYLNTSFPEFDVSRTATVKFVNNNVLVYYRDIIKYDPATYTLTVDIPFDNYPQLSTNSRYEIYENSLKKPLYPIESDNFIRNLHNGIYFMKKINPNDISPVILRENWTKNAKYNFYDSKENMTLKNYTVSLDYAAESAIPLTGASGTINLAASTVSLTQKPISAVNLDIIQTKKYNYYVMNSYLQVFKCMYSPRINNVIQPSKNEPLFFPGNYDDKTNIITTADGYKWKFLYQIPPNKIKFINDKYIPVIVPPESENLIGAGRVEVVNVIHSGTKNNSYEYKIKIDGDGEGLDLNITWKKDNTINSVQIKNPGIGYSYVNLYVAKAQTGKDTFVKDDEFVLEGIISPIGGTGYNLLSELGCENLMVTTEFFGDENIKNIPIRQFGIIANPKQKIYSGYVTATNDEYITCSTLKVFSADNVTVNTEYYQKNGDEVIFRGTCIYKDQNTLFFVNVFKTPSINRQLLKGEDRRVVGSRVMSITDWISPIQKYTGDIIYVQNVQELTSVDTTSNFFKIILNY